jgi:exodeoxyribonuclease V alpha subunit
LDTIFRQAQGSQIITNAHRINQGRMPDFSPPAASRRGIDPQSPSDQHPPALGDFFLFPAEGASSAADWVMNVVVERIPRKFGFDPVMDIQVLAPMYRGAAGVNTLNDKLQQHLNPQKDLNAEVSLFGVKYRPGDKVMQVQNNYDKEVFNGDIGFITRIDRIEHTLDVSIDNRVVSYDFSEADQLVLAYAVTVHKAQGSEFPVVVIPVITAHYLMLQRNLLYTAVTRARKLCVLVGGRKAIGISVRNNKVAHRHTGLSWRLQGLMGSNPSRIP